MIVKKPSSEQRQAWHALWKQYKDLIRPNRKTGPELLNYLQQNYTLTEIFDDDVVDVIVYNVMMNQTRAAKLPVGAVPVPRAFYLENTGQGEKFYRSESKDDADIWGNDITRIFVGIDLSSGFYMVEGSTMLWDELCCFQGVDEEDLKNEIIVAQYVNALHPLGQDL